MLATIAKTWRFEAAHVLLHHEGKCARPHGHSYEVTVAVRGPIRPADGRPDEGMVCDFDDLKAIWKRDAEPLLDHQDLNETIGKAIGPTTAENIACWIARVFSRHFEVAYVELRETATSLVRVEGDDLR